MAKDCQINTFTIQTARQDIWLEMILELHEFLLVLLGV